MSDMPLADPTPFVDPRDLTYELQPQWIFENAARCRSCQAPIAWATHEHTGRKAPFNPDGTSHFASCPQAGTWRKRG